MKTAENIDSHSDARNDSIGAKTDADSTPSKLSVNITGLATIASAWAKLSAPIRNAILAIVRDESGAENVTGLANNVASVHARHVAACHPSVRQT